MMSDKDNELIYDYTRFCFTKLLGFLMVSILQLRNYRGCLRRHLNFILKNNNKDIIEITKDTNKGNMKKIFYGILNKTYLGM